MTPEQIIKRIAEVAANVGFHAGIGSSETAGMIVSVLAEHPEYIEPFLTEGVEFMLSGKVAHENGCLTFHRMLDGKVTTPQELRAAIMVKNMERGRPADSKRK